MSKETAEDDVLVCYSKIDVSKINTIEIYNSVFDGLSSEQKYTCNRIWY
jgi:hypothetical protein